MSAETEDHGELLTKFEELFGSLVEHEVLKMVLQSCDWHSNSALDMVLSMIDPDQLPQHVRSAVTAQAVLRGAIINSDSLFSRSPISGVESPVPEGESPIAATSIMTPENLSTVELSGANTSILTSRNSSVPELSDRAATSATVNDLAGEMSDATVTTENLHLNDEAHDNSQETLQLSEALSSNNGSPTNSLLAEPFKIDSRPYYHNDVLTPFAMAQESIAREPFLMNDLRRRPSSTLQSSPIRAGEHDILQGEAETLSEKDSDNASLPNSPFRPSAPSVLDSEENQGLSMAQWVLAPEFVPNAFHRNRPPSNGEFWPLNSNYSFMAINQESAVPSRKTNRQNELSVKPKISKKEEIVNKLLSGIKMVVLMRGLPGSGKSSLAKELKGHSGVVLSTDDFFNDKYGRYVYEPSKLHEAHAWNKNRVRLRLREKRSPIIVDNTNLQIWEMKPYVKLALQNGYEVDILEPETPWKVNPKELAKRNTHGVPKDKIKEMKERYDLSIKIDHVIAAVGDVKADSNEASNSGLKRRKSPVKTEWPTTLPDPMLNEKSVMETYKNNIVHREVDANARDIPSVDYLTPVIKPLCMISDSVNPRKYVTAESSLSYLQTYKGIDSEDDDADVIIEGYEDLEESEHGAIASEKAESHSAGQCDLHEHVRSTFSDSESLQRKNSKDTFDSKEGSVEELSPKEHSVENARPKLDHICHPSGMEDEDDVMQTKGVDNSAGLQNINMQDEESLRMLLEEANLDQDGHSDDWDDLVRKANEDDWNDEKFNELVNDLGSTVRCELGKKLQGNFGENQSDGDSGEYAEDFAMYDFCSTVEDKIGRSLSSVVARPVGAGDPSSLFSFINTESMDLVKDQEAGGPELIAVRTSEIYEVSNDKDTVISSHCGEGLTSHTKENVHKPNGKDMSADIDSDMSHCPESISGEKELTKKDSAQSEEDDLEKPHHKSQETQSVPDDTKEVNIINHTNKNELPNHTKLEVSVGTCPSSLTSWEYVESKDSENAVDWDPSDEDIPKGSEMKRPKPTRDRRRASGDPQKWLYSENGGDNDKGGCKWEPVGEGASASWDETAKTRVVDHVQTDLEPQPHTGAVPKMRKNEVKHSSSVSSIGNYDSSIQNVTGKSSLLMTPLSKSATVDMVRSTNYKDASMCKQQVDSETQTLSIDFEALDLDNNLYELKILYGQPSYIPACNGEMMLLANGPLTKGKLMLDKGTMTDSQSEVVLVKPLRNLVAFFPDIPEANLRDVLEKCKYDLDWTMNVLLDSGYEMAESVAACNSQDGSEIGIEDVENNLDVTSTSEDMLEALTVSDHRDLNDVVFEEKNKRLKQSQEPRDLVCKKEIENSFAFPDTVDDRVTRLTGKDFENLNLNKVKQKKTKKKHSKKRHSEGSSGATKEAMNWEEGEGAQYITLIMDTLFASQLVSMFGPIGTCGMSGDMAPEDRSVILPLELCHQIHKYWTKTLDGKFNHEAEVLDSLIRDDENLARRLQEEEEQVSKNASCNANSSSLENSEKAFQLDPPTNLKEIMDLEQALLESQSDKNTVCEGTLSSHLNLQRLYAEYPHVDREALKEEFTESGFNYQDTVRSISKRYGFEKEAPKVVIAPEFLEQHEQQMLEKAKQLSLDQRELEEAKHLEDDGDLQPDNPQVYRDEAQTHYHQRQEFYRKAQEAHRQGMKAAAAFYANLGKLHSEKLNEANQRASVKILEAVNAKKDANVLDLHLLHVNEALSATQAFLSERKKVLTARNINQMQVSLITGRGAHSIGGQARLKPAVKDFLQKSGYLFHEENSGMFLVTLQR